ncbi:Xpo1 domain-containing protein [Haematococcus lacustris]|uniref:Xpo1 domain-containing protein n=1 Tax=Haematococcus lacustris TaxID=44745 RepID=A0A6A0AAA0_HAELA|nr:Xpo1 domain-containing protein [Haematococcus lacustris]
MAATYELVLQALSVLQSPTASVQERTNANHYLEQTKNRWSALSEVEHSQLSKLAYQNTALVCGGGRAAWPLKTKAAVLLAAVVRQQGVDVYNQLVPQLIQQAAEGPVQAELACLVLHFISEDLTLFDTVQGEWV